MALRRRCGRAGGGSVAMVQAPETIRAGPAADRRRRAGNTYERFVPPFAAI